eukprot:scaffold49044_cov73-Phaeocystis_antarctica.AAC.3
MAGALMTGTHGGSAHHQSTASMIRGCRMVLADGSIKDIGEVCNAETSLVYMSPPPHALTIPDRTTSCSTGSSRVWAC